jgi:hypothetical protein
MLGTPNAHPWHETRDTLIQKKEPRISTEDGAN